jgi:hypothetical protein
MTRGYVANYEYEDYDGAISMPRMARQRLLDDASRKLVDEIVDNDYHVVRIETTDEPSHFHPWGRGDSRRASVRVEVNPVRHHDVVMARHKDLDVYVPRYKTVEKVIEIPVLKTAKDRLLSFLHELTSPVIYDGPTGEFT